MTRKELETMTKDQLIDLVLKNADSSISLFNELEKTIQDLENENKRLNEKLNPPLTWDLPAWTITPGTRKGAIEIYFDKMPGTGIIAQLKDLKMRWNSKKKCWYGFIPPADVETLFKEAAAA